MEVGCELRRYEHVTLAPDKMQKHSFMMIVIKLDFITARNRLKNRITTGCSGKNFVE
jgi:hypothetical protein